METEDVLPKLRNLLRLHVYVKRNKTFFLSKIKRGKNIHFSFRREKLLRTSIIIEIIAVL
jgi:hypothetical protein